MSSKKVFSGLEKKSFKAGTYALSSYIKGECPKHANTDNAAIALVWIVMNNFRKNGFFSVQCNIMVKYQC